MTLPSHQGGTMSYKKPVHQRSESLLNGFFSDFSESGLKRHTEKSARTLRFDRLSENLT
jgi:hypothetical protein